MQREWPRWFAVLVGVAQAACLECKEVETTERASSRLVAGTTELAPNGAFVFEGRRYASCTEFCKESGVFLDVEGCATPTADKGMLELSCTGVRASCHDGFSLGSGRYTDGIAPATAPLGLADYFACMMHGEQAAGIAFARMARELAAFGAPMELTLRCLDAVADERRHARTFRRMLVAAQGSAAILRELSSEEVERASAPRDLEQLLAENVVEGCLGETIGAWVLAIQSERAVSRRARAAFRAIARDEARHADTSLRIANAFPRAMASDVVRSAFDRALASRGNDPYRHLTRGERSAIGAPTPHEYAAIVARVQSWLAKAIGPSVREAA